MSPSRPEQHPDEHDDLHAPSSVDPTGEQEPGTIRARLIGAGRVFAVVVGPLLAVYALRFGKTVLIPLFAGIFLAVVVRPIHREVGARLPRGLKWLGLMTAMLSIVAGLALFGGALALSGRAVAEELRERRPQIETQLERVRGVAARVGIDVPGGGSGATNGTAGNEQDQAGEANAAESQGGGRAQRTLRTIVAGLGTLLLTRAFAALGLAETAEARRRIARTGRGPGARRALAAIDEAVPAFRRYVWVKSLTSLLTGLATWLAALAFGLPLAWVWGFLAFLLEYVPSVGSVIAIVPPTLMALAEGGPAKAAAVFLVIGALQVFFGNVVDPRLEGKLMALSPFGVLLSIVFWGWLWGPVGALLAVPLTVAVVIACRHIPGAQGVATVVAGDGLP